MKFSIRLLGVLMMLTIFSFNILVAQEAEETPDPDALPGITLSGLLDELPSPEPDLSSFPVTVENCGRELTFDAPPQRVISLWQPPTEMLLALGLEDNFVAIAGTYTEYPDNFVDAVAQIPAIGTAMSWPSREVLLSYEPDFVISEGLDSFGYDAAQGYATVAEIEATGAQVYSSAACYFTEPEQRTIEDIFEDIRTLGVIFGVSERAEVLIERMQTRLDAVVEAVADQEPVTVAFYNGGEGPLFVLSLGIWADLMVKAGGQDVFADLGQIQVSVEEFAVANPDVILVGYFPGGDVEPRIAYIESTFSSLDAVQNGRIYPIATIDTEYGIRIIEGLEQIAQALYPDAFDE